nr:ATP-dependent DNA helicase RecQ-like isoform X2 [Crassostrea gigas]
MADIKFDEAVNVCLQTRQLDFKLKDLQLSVLKDVIVHNKDVLAVLPTGYGKTIIYSLILTIVDNYIDVSNTIVIVISPLVALMEDQVVNIEETGIRCVYASKTQSQVQKLGESWKVDLFRSS